MKQSSFNSFCMRAALIGLLAWSGLAQAQNLQPRGSVGLKVQADSTRVVELPLDQHWSLQSLVRLPGATSTQGLKLGVSGGYGWDLSSESRFAVFAGVGLSDRNPSTPAAGYLSAPGTQSYYPPPAAAYGKDLLLNLVWDWNLSNELALTSGLRVSRGVGELPAAAIPGGPQNNNSTGYIGLKLRF